MGNCAGVDWAGEKHDVRVADETGEELLAATFAHDEKGLRALCRTLLRLKVELVAIERPDGLLVERLLDAGLRVLPMHPKQVAASRARFRAAGGKSDRFARSCCASWRAPTATASGCSSPTRTRRRRCGR
jgi:hypothetical protein